jgi:hypothetical protein
VPKQIKYMVLTADNFHAYDDDDGVDESGQFDTADEAIAAAKAIVDKSLRWELSSRAPAIMTGAELFDHWLDFGDSPGIRSPQGKPEAEFSASDYALKKAMEICQNSESGLPE